MSLDYTIYNRQMNAARERGRSDALDLRARSANMDGTGLIAEERKCPVFDPQKDYSDWARGAPVRELVDGEYQVFVLLQPHNAAHYPTSTPSSTPSLWGLCHTKDPAHAKPFVPPLGTSGLYMDGECCTADGRVYRHKGDNGAYSPAEYPANWEDLGTIEEVALNVSGNL